MRPLLRAVTIEQDAAMPASPPPGFAKGRDAPATLGASLALSTVGAPRRQRGPTDNPGPVRPAAAAAAAGPGRPARPPRARNRPEQIDAERNGRRAERPRRGAARRAAVAGGAGGGAGVMRNRSEQAGNTGSRSFLIGSSYNLFFSIP